MTKRIYFKGLNGIRAIAAMIVVIFHIDPVFGKKSIGFYEHHWAAYGVTLFFVLSGFLITYLLLEEKQKTGTISLKNFYIRRVLRIWPLYYLIILLTLTFARILPDINFSKSLWPSLGLYSFLLANVAYTAHLAISTLTPLWSVGVEEQFYAVWPLILKNVSKIGVALSIIIPVYLVIKFGAYYVNPDLYEFISLTRIDCMAIGGLGAVLLKRRSKLLKVAYHPFLQILSWILLLVSTLYRPVHVPLISHEVYSVFFSRDNSQCQYQP